MLEKPEITQTEAESTAVIHLTIPREGIRSAMGPGMKEVIETVAAQGITPRGPMFARHFRIDPDIFDFKIGVPIDTTVANTGRVTAGELPSARVARTTYIGPYEGLGAAWEEFDTWIADNGKTPSGDLVERYVVGPESGPDSAGYRTELIRPLI